MAARILIAEDSDSTLMLLERTLTDEGYEVIPVQDGETALELASSRLPDLVVLDVMMPGKIGYQVCRDLKGDPETKDIYILFITGRGSPLTHETSDMYGGDAIIFKPLDIDELKEKVSTVLNP